MKKIKEVVGELGVTSEIYEVTIDEIAEGLPEVIRATVSKGWRKEVDQWVDKIIVDKAKEGRIFRLELHCKNGAVIPSDAQQDDVTPTSLALAFSECLDRLDICIRFYHYQVKHERQTKSNVIPLRKH